MTEEEELMTSEIEEFIIELESNVQEAEKAHNGTTIFAY